MCRWQLISASVTFLFLCGFQSYAKPELTDEDKRLVDLVSQLGQSPKLMDRRYLTYGLGAAEAKMEPGPIPHQTCEWLDPSNHNLLYKLDRQVDLDKDVSDCKFTVFVPPKSKIDFKCLESVFGSNASKQFDQRIYTAETFGISPTTNVVAWQPTRCFKVNEIMVQYKGPRLPTPTQEEIEAAITSRREQAFKHHEKGHHEQAFPMLTSHLQERPTDAEARLRLAESYKAQFCINEAIEQYRLAFDLAGSDQVMRQRCIDGLKLLKVFPAASGGLVYQTNSPAGQKPDNRSNWTKFLPFSSKKPKAGAYEQAAAYSADAKTDGSSVSAVADRSNPLDAGF